MGVTFSCTIHLDNLVVLHIIHYTDKLCHYGTELVWVNSVSDAQPVSFCFIKSMLLNSSSATSVCFCYSRYELHIFGGFVDKAGHSMKLTTELLGTYLSC